MYPVRHVVAREVIPREDPVEYRGHFKDDWHTFPYKDSYRSKDFSKQIYKPNELHRSKRLPLDGEDTWHDRRQMFDRNAANDQDVKFDRNLPSVEKYYNKHAMSAKERIPDRRADHHDERPYYDRVIDGAKEMKDSLEKPDKIPDFPVESHDEPKPEPVKEKKKTKLPDSAPDDLKSAAEMIDDLENKIDQESKKLESIKSSSKHKDSLSKGMENL